MRTETDKLLLIGRIAAAVALVIVVAWVAGMLRELGAPGYGGEAIDIDFTVFWSAAKLTLAEGPFAPFDNARLQAERGLPADLVTAPMLWFYPPAWLTLLLPLGKLPFFWAWAVFAGVSAIFFAAVNRPAARVIPGLWLVVVASPAVLFTLALGQNSLIFAGLLVLALEAMRRDNAVLAGLAIAAMTMKPQLGLAIPFALVAAGQWRVIFWAAAGTAAILAASLVWPGPGYWPHFLQALGDSRDLIRGTILPAMMPTPYSVVHRLGFDDGVALTIHAAIAAVLLFGLVRLWATSMDFDRKAAALAVAIVLVTPYAIYYELVFALVGVMYLARAGMLRARLAQVLAALVWLAPVIGIVMLTGPGFAVIVPLLLGVFALAALRPEPRELVA
jgi:hypothetical protein